MQGINKQPLFVAVSDIHFNSSSLDVASEALREATGRAARENVPLVIAGDLNDTKAIIRGEVANRLIKFFETQAHPTYLLVGNHDALSEKGADHGLHYLSPYLEVVDSTRPLFGDVVAIPYQNSQEKFKEQLAGVEPGSIIVMHQGVKGAWMGDYVQDKTSIDPELLRPFKVISGHYHRHQTVGPVTYIGSPYTVTFGEANDGPKGCLLVYDDGSFDQLAFDHILRRHIIEERNIADLERPIEGLRPHDLLWLKVTGPYTDLQKLKKRELGERLVGHQNFKLDKLALDNGRKTDLRKQMTGEQLFDTIIDRTAEHPAQKARLKAMWRGLM